MVRVFAVIFAVAAICAVGCTWESRVPRGKPIKLPENAPRGIRPLQLCESVQGVLECDARERECNHWYRVDVLEPGELRVSLSLGQSDGSGRLTRLVVRPLGKPILGQAISNQGEAISVVAQVQPDLYGVLVQGGGARRSYRLKAALVPPGTPENESCPERSEDTSPGA